MVQKQKYADYFYKDIAENVKTIFDTSNYEVGILLPKGKNKKLIGLMKDELGGKIMTKFVWLKAKTYSYLIDDESEDKKSKKHKKSVAQKENLNLKIINTFWKQLNLITKWNI